MLLRFLGHAAFDLTLGGVRFCLDPHKPGALNGRFQLPEIVGPFAAILHTHWHEDHAAWTPALGTANVVDSEGVFRGVELRSRAVFHDTVAGRQAGLVRMISLRAEGVRVVHCGDIGAFDPADVAWLQGTTVLLVPAGGKYTLGPREACELALQSAALAVVPMHCADARVDLPLAPVDAFFAAWSGAVAAAPSIDNAALAALNCPTAFTLSA